jgi:DNA mismatch repair ATPase MutS
MSNAALHLSATTSHLRLIAPMTDDSERFPTIEAPPLSEPDPTRPEASERPAIAPPARVPDADELATTAIASTKPPAWWADSFLAKELGTFADHARALREGRDRNHAELISMLSEQRIEQRNALDKVTRDMAQLALEMNANLEMLSGEFRRHRDTSDARDAEQNGRIHQLERQFEQLEGRLIQVMQERFTEALRPIADEMQQFRDALAQLKADVAARPQTPTPG